jgi:ribosomal protein S18
MGFSLKGLITGIATTAGEVMDEERKQTNALIAQRTKNSFENYNKYQETTEALRADIKKRDAQLLNFQPDLTEQERVAAAGIPNLVDMYQRMLTEGKQVTVRDMIKVSDKTAGMRFDSYVSEIGKIQPTETTAAVPVSTKFFGPSAESQRNMGEKAATATGVSESELRGFERMPATATVPSMGSIKTDVFKKEPKKPTSVEDAYNMSQLDMMNAQRDKGVDSPEYKQAKANRELANTYLSSVSETLGKRADRLRNTLIDEPDAGKKKQLSEELVTVENSMKAHSLAISTKDSNSDEDKKKTYNAIKTSVDDFVNNRMRDDEGASWRKYVDFKTTKMEDGTVYTSRTQKAEMPIEEQRKMFAAERTLAKQALISNGYISPTGVPLYNAVAEVMNNRNIPIGREALPASAAAPVAAPASPAATPAATPSATPSATPAVTATPAAPIIVTAPNGQVLQFPNQAAADEFEKKLAGIK